MSSKQPLTPREKKAQLHGERWRLLDQIVALMRVPMTVLSFVWAGLIIVTLVWGLPPSLSWLNFAIWAVFVFDFVLEFAVAPNKRIYLRNHWLMALSLALPAFSTIRVVAGLRIVRAAVMSGSFSVLGIVAAVNRSMAALRHVMQRRKVGYVVALTILVTLAGAAGMYHFENPAMLRAQGFGATVQQGGGLHNYGEAVWWTAMIMTTIGSQYWPVTLAGRILAWFLAVYAMSIFGYITAIVASYFVGGDVKAGQRQDQEGTTHDLRRVESELAALREQISVLVERTEGWPLPGDMVRETRQARGTDAQRAGTTR